VEHLWTATDSLPDVCFTANAGRSHFSHRLVVSGSQIGELRDRLAAHLREGNHVARGAFDGPAPKIVFRFSGNDSAIVNAGRELYDTQPTFRAAVDRCAAVFQARGNETAAAFAVQFALAELWRSWGIEPSAVTGEGVGELVAACVAGVMELDAALGLAIADGAAVAGVTCRAPQIAFAVGGRVLAPGEIPDGASFLARAREASELEAGLAALNAEGFLTVLDITPESGDWPRLLETLGTLYIAGAAIDWATRRVRALCDRS
jgi:acyl transferase domain-containing protein